jgi:DNA-binding MarR family transcriptional regulator
MTLTLDSFLPYRLSRLAEAVSQEMRPVYKNMHGLNRPEWRIIAALAEIGPTTATVLVAHSAQHKTKVSRAVRALETRRWLTRDTDPRDSRVEVLTLTPLGRQAYGTLVEPMRAREARILDRLSVRERTALDTALTALERAMAVAPSGPGDRG